MPARKRKTPSAPVTATPAAELDVFDAAIAAQSEPADGPAPGATHVPATGEQPAADAAAKSWQPDPFPVMTLSLGDSPDALQVRLFRNRRMNQVAIRFDDKPAEPHRQRLRDAGYKWREAEGVWTRQLGDERASGQLAAERLVVEVANSIRAEAGLATVGRAVGE